MSRFPLPRLGRWPRLVLAGLCLLLAAASSGSAQAGGGRTVAVLVAARDLPAGHRLAAADVRTVRWPSGLAPPGRIRAPAAARGRRLAGPLGRGEPLTTTRLVGRDLTAGLPAGTVAVPVTVAGARTADLVSAGDRVELVATGRTDDAATDVPIAATGEVSVVATRLLVLGVQPNGDGTATDLVVAADHDTALRLVRVGVSQVLAAVGDSP